MYICIPYTYAIRCINVSVTLKLLRSSHQKRRLTIPPIIQRDLKSCFENSHYWYGRTVGPSLAYCSLRTSTVWNSYAPAVHCTSCPQVSCRLAARCRQQTLTAIERQRNKRSHGFFYSCLHCCCLLLCIATLQSLHYTHTSSSLYRQPSHTNTNNDHNHNNNDETQQ